MVTNHPELKYSGNIQWNSIFLFTFGPDTQENDSQGLFSTPCHIHCLVLTKDYKQQHFQIQFCYKKYQKNKKEGHELLKSKEPHIKQYTNYTPRLES